MLERALQAAPDEPGVKRVVAVLDEHGSMREAQERPARVLELGRSDQHRALDVVTPARIGVDRGAAVDQRVEKRQRAGELEPLGADLEDQERGVAGGLDVQGNVLGFLESGLRFELRRVDGDFLPWHGFDRTARLEQHRLLCPTKSGISRGPLRGGHLASARALRAKAISSEVTARSRSAAPAYTAAPTTIGMTTWTPSRFRSGNRTAPMTRPARIGRHVSWRTGT